MPCGRHIPAGGWNAGGALGRAAALRLMLSSLLLGENSVVNQFRVACFGMLLLGILMLIAAMRSRVKGGQ